MDVYYNVAPRYTVGSPAQVDEATALRIAHDEKAFYNRQSEGMFGEYAAKRAKQEGLEGIVYSVCEKRAKMYVTDLITGARFVVPSKEWFGTYWHKRTDRTTYLIPEPAVP